jgi:GNAT superfamily N-acetyltransferase
VDFRIRSIHESELERFSGILQEVASWLEARGEPLWPLASIQPEALLRKNKLDEFYLGFVSAELASCMILQDLDQAFWPDDTVGEALYLHKLAVRREFAGLGLSQLMLDWAKAKALEQGRRFLKLDTVSSMPKLNKLYKDYGFSYCGEKQVGIYLVSLYQLDLRET